MARPNLELIRALRATAERLSQGARYRWSHFAHCNCGNLVQTITHLPPREIYAAAFERPGDWAEQAREFCPGSGYPMDYILRCLFGLGLEREDVGHLERLSDPQVRRHIGMEVPLHHSRREDVVRYLRAWAQLLEARLPRDVPADSATEAEIDAWPEAAE